MKSINFYKKIEKVRILLVDDEPNIVKIVNKRLVTEGFEVLVAMDGMAALEMAAAELPSLIILDVMLPKLSGIEVCRRLKHDARTQKIPILMLTALAQESDEASGVAAGTDAYIRKPFRAQQLLQKVRELISI
ncbi:MAG: two-component system response regulator [Candidatus Omnitrophica bacterium CG07_land_8_20_14_0_80_50_8]|nr:MAG: two-component system response regulator [Candidatus Omnitrophica bacterium CG07_land_8_20_14_0_80_50_8]